MQPVEVNSNMNYAVPYAAPRIFSREAQAISPSPAFVTERRVVPFDQLIKFDLTGNRGNVLSDIFNISIEGPFVAVAMSYSVLLEEQIDFGPRLDEYGPATFGGVSIFDLRSGLRTALRRRGVPEAQIPAIEERARRGGMRLNPNLADRILRQDPQKWLSFSLDNLGDDVERLFQAVTCIEQEISFLYRLMDNATGRDFQSAPIHNIAGLGKANGDRPFRFFPQPILLAPRSVIRVEITEISGLGRLFFVLQGYKVLGSESQLQE